MKGTIQTIFQSALSLIIATLLIVPGGFARADHSPGEEISERMQMIIDHQSAIIQKWATSPEIIASIKEQNSQNIPLDEIKKIDHEWQDGGQNKLASRLQYSKAGRFLKNKILSNSRLYAEAFLCDRQGAVVGEYPRTTDYWQGDEAKFIDSFNNGDGKIIYGHPQYDQSTKTFTVQISIPVFDKSETIGVLIVGLRNIH